MTTTTPIRHGGVAGGDQRQKQQQRPPKDIQISSSSSSTQQSTSFFIKKNSKVALLKFFAYVLPWFAWILNVIILTTCYFQTANVSICSTIDTTFCVPPLKVNIGLTRTCYDYDDQTNKYFIKESFAAAVSAAADGGDDDSDYYINLAMGFAIVPVVLGSLLVCSCCGPVLLGEFEEGQNVLWTLSALAYGLNSICTGLTLLSLNTDLCHDENICQMALPKQQDGVGGSGSGGGGGFVRSDVVTEFYLGTCEQDCTIGTGATLTIVTTIFWLMACPASIVLKKSNKAKKHKGVVPDHSS